MIDHSLNKILFFDIETVGLTPDLTSLSKNYPEHYRLFLNYIDWFKRKYVDVEGMDNDQIYESKSADTRIW